ncbi:hypothetical protein AVEN_261049-1 [Araneus ventricosus]|uniref:Uncharacterized protein n=1 Tax=Araneus ventricosus TaxID=182803 RepID=A0A4Y2G208_ARAVE|nr:hypothetical protein AVEN_261049-1 [Araneus ventricosus]
MPRPVGFSLVKLESRFEATRGLFWTGLAILNSSQMTRTTPELAPPLQTSAPHQLKNVWPLTYDLACNSPNTRRIFRGIGFRTWPQNRDLTTRLPRPQTDRE